MLPRPYHPFQTLNPFVSLLMETGPSSPSSSIYFLCPVSSNSKRYYTVSENEQSSTEVVDNSLPGKILVCFHALLSKFSSNLFPHGSFSTRCLQALQELLFTFYPANFSFTAEVRYSLLTWHLHYTFRIPLVFLWFFSLSSRSYLVLQTHHVNVQDALPVSAVTVGFSSVQSFITINLNLHLCPAFGSTSDFPSRSCDILRQLSDLIISQCTKLCLRLLQSAVLFLSHW